MKNSSKNLLPLVVITASVGGCMMLFETEARPETASVTAAQEVVLADNLAKLPDLATTSPGLIRAEDHAPQQMPLHWASSVGDQDVVAWLLEQNVGVDARGSFQLRTGRRGQVKVPRRSEAPTLFHR